MDFHSNNSSSDLLFKSLVMKPQNMLDKNIYENKYIIDFSSLIFLS
jgi:hypothetical protein